MGPRAEYDSLSAESLELRKGTRDGVLAWRERGRKIVRPAWSVFQQKRDEMSLRRGAIQTTG